MIVDIAGSSVTLIGDPHFGRSFNGTPLHRTGEREKMQLSEFDKLLNTGTNLVVMVGDLFDKPVVPLTVIVDVAMILVKASAAHPETTFVLMAGNHDRSRQTVKLGAWDLLSLITEPLQNVVTLNEPQIINQIGFFPWQWTTSAIEQVENLGGKMVAAVGHWDLMTFNGDDSHLAPTEFLNDKFGITTFYSGHYHTPGPYQVESFVVNCTGSMQPYTHAEDPEGVMYVTLTLSEALEQAEQLKDKCVRVRLQPGEILPDIDCLQLTKADQGGPLVEVEVSTQAIDMNRILADEFLATETPKPVQFFITEKLGDLT